MSKLYIIATPIGNLGDITDRAIKSLKSVNTILAEDTRVTIKLVNHLGLENKKLISFNKDSEEKKLELVLDYLNSGIDIALVSDAGTPLISDPGFVLVKALYGTDHEIIPIPGASSLSTALSICPIDTIRYVYEGFLPHGPKQRRRILRDLESEKRAIVFFESPHRIKKTLEDISAIFGEATEVFLARELTKKFEQKYYGAVQEVLAQLIEQFPNEVQGEFVMIIKKST
jgi:16S rRNA (cytidine1402-2'-O)-methyltransferase